ncbi:MAG: hypothetical protein ACI9LO_001244 [Planctomycetota bacterium]|jgi:hypothetical protein
MHLYFVSFLASFSAFFSLGDNAAFFLVSRLFLCSLLMLLTPGNREKSVPTEPARKSDQVWKRGFSTTEIDGE